MEPRAAITEPMGRGGTCPLVGSPSPRCVPAGSDHEPLSLLPSQHVVPSGRYFASFKADLCRLLTFLHSLLF